MDKIRKYEDLIVWRKARDLVLQVYRVTKQFPKEERFGLVQQLRRSAASVATNIAEGFGRYHTKEFINFLYISRGSLYETEYSLSLSYDLKFISLQGYSGMKNLSLEVGRMLNGLIRSLKNTNH